MVFYSLCLFVSLLIAWYLCCCWFYCKVRFASVTDTCCLNYQLSLCFSLSELLDIRALIFHIWIKWAYKISWRSINWEGTGQTGWFTTYLHTFLVTESHGLLLHTLLQQEEDEGTVVNSDPWYIINMYHLYIISTGWLLFFCEDVQLNTLLNMLCKCLNCSLLKISHCCMKLSSCLALKYF